MATKNKPAVVEGDEELTLFEKLQRDIKAPKPLRVTDSITLYCPTKKQLEASQAAETEEASNRALIGDQYDELVAYFDDQPPHYWAEFNRVYLNHFFDVQSESPS